MSRTGSDTWSMTIRRRGAGRSTNRLPLRIAVRGMEVEIVVNNGRALVLARRELAEFVLDLQGAGRLLVSADAARTVADYAGPREKWAPIMTPDEIEAADRAADDQLGDSEGTTVRPSDERKDRPR